MYFQSSCCWGSKTESNTISSGLKQGFSYYFPTPFILSVGALRRGIAWPKFSKTVPSAPIFGHFGPENGQAIPLPEEILVKRSPPPEPEKIARYLVLSTQKKAKNRGSKKFYLLSVQYVTHLVTCCKKSNNHVSKKKLSRSYKEKYWKNNGKMILLKWKLWRSAIPEFDSYRPAAIVMHFISFLE